MTLSWIQIGGGAIAAFVLSFFIHSWDVNRIEKKWQTKLDTQKTELENKCLADQVITKGANDELEKNRTDIIRKRDSAKRVQPARCVVPATGEADAAAGGTGHAGQDGVTSDALRDYAAEAREYQTQRMILEKFIDETWMARGQ